MVTALMIVLGLFFLQALDSDRLGLAFILFLLVALVVML